MPATIDWTKGLLTGDNGLNLNLKNIYGQGMRMGGAVNPDQFSEYSRQAYAKALGLPTTTAAAQLPGWNDIAGQFGSAPLTQWGQEWAKTPWTVYSAQGTAYDPKTNLSIPPTSLAPPPPVDRTDLTGRGGTLGRIRTLADVLGGNTPPPPVDNAAGLMDPWKNQPPTLQTPYDVTGGTPPANTTNLASLLTQRNNGRTVAVPGTTPSSTATDFNERNADRTRSVTRQVTPGGATPSVAPGNISTTPGPNDVPDWFQKWMDEYPNPPKTYSSGTLFDTADLPPLSTHPSMEDVLLSPEFDVQKKELLRNLNDALASRGRSNSTFAVQTLDDALQKLIAGEVGRQDETQFNRNLILNDLLYGRRTGEDTTNWNRAYALSQLGLNSVNPQVEMGMGSSLADLIMQAALVQAQLQSQQGAVSGGMWDTALSSPMDLWNMLQGNKQSKQLMDLLTSLAGK